MTNEIFKVPCPSLDRILTLKKLNDNQLLRLVNKLRKIVKNSKAGNLDVIAYVRTVINGILIKEDVKVVDSLIQVYNPVKQWENIRSILALVYNSITEYYPHVRMELICEDINGLLDPPKTSDEEFDNYLNKSKKLPLTSIEDIKKLEKIFKTDIVGQDEAIESVLNCLKLKAAGFCKRRINSGTKRSVPLTLMFVGKSGVGKTFLARLLGDYYSANFWQLNCAEFAHGHEINRLLGSPPGYIGSTGTSIVKEKAAKGNKHTILLDEVEKAQDKLYNLLLSWMETGYIADNSGNECDFSESIFILTTNSGVKDLKKSFMSLGSTSGLTSKVATKEELEKAVERDFTPEFRNRIDEFVYFNELTRDDVVKIATNGLKEYPVNRSKDLIDFIVSNSYSPEYGAREVARFIKTSIALPLADCILSKKLPKTPNLYDVAINNNKIEIVNTL